MAYYGHYLQLQAIYCGQIKHDKSTFSPDEWRLISCYDAAMMLSLLIAPLGNDAFAYEGVNECEILKGKMRDQFTELSLDEPYKSVSERFGVQYEFYEDGAVQITSLHADLSDELYEKDIDASLLEGVI